MEKRRLGKTGFDTTIMGLGGEGILRSSGLDKQAYKLINKALDLGINYCESARAYEGSEEYYGKALRERRKDIFLAGKSHARTKEGALDHLHETLRNMKTDHLDLWQIHDVRNDKEIEEIFSPGGAIDAFIEAREKGLTRFIGITGHQDPLVIRQCLLRFDFDTVLMPVNPAEPSYKSFLEEVMPLAIEKGMGVMGMKLYLHGFVSKFSFYTSMESFFRYALSQSIATAVIGCDNLEQLEENVYFVRSFKPMDWEEQDGFVEAIAPFARELMYYKE